MFALHSSLITNIWNCDTDLKCEWVSEWSCSYYINDIFSSSWGDDRLGVDLVYDIIIYYVLFSGCRCKYYM